MTFLEKLDLLMKSSDLNKHKLSILSGIPYTTIDGFYKKGYENAKISTVRKIAKALGCSLDYLIEDDADTKKSPSASERAMMVARAFDGLDDHGRRLIELVVKDQRERMETVRTELERLPDNVIPIQRSQLPASAGTGVYLGPEDMEIIQVVENDLTRRASFCVPVSGDSMEPDFHDGDILLVEGCEDIPVGKIGVFTVDGDGYVKERGEGELISLNPAYPPVPMVEDVTWCNGLVIGVLDPEWIVEK